MVIIMATTGRRLVRTTTPPDSLQTFRSEQPLATKQLIQENQISLRANKTHGAYSSDLDYLDVQFRLLREDLVNSLREAIYNFKEDPGNKNLRKVYRNLTFIGPQTHSHGIAYTFKLDKSTREYQFAKRAGSKNLQFGSLLALSTDQFNSVFVFATIAESRDIPRGYFDVTILDQSRGDFHEHFEVPSQSSKHITITAVESEAFCEAYIHVLKALQRIDEVPFSKYIVSCQMDVSPPSYLTQNQSYQLFDLQGNQYMATPHADEWPTAAELGLNPSQFDAYKLALKNELAVIQGPPGTGKTFVGTRLVQVLLHSLYGINQNSSISTPRVMNTPLLMVCYTNHALDQFLEETLKFCSHNDVVRVGSKSKSVELQRCNISKKSQVGDGYDQTMRSLTREKYGLQSKKTMEATKQKLRTCKSSLVFHTHLNTIPDYFLTQFEQMGRRLPRDREMFAIFYWLNCEAAQFDIKKAQLQGSRKNNSMKTDQIAPAPKNEFIELTMKDSRRLDIEEDEDSDGDNEETEQTTENDENTETTETTDNTENTELIEITETNESTQTTENTDPTDITESTETTENTEATENTENNQMTENTSPTENTENNQATENTEATENNQTTGNIEATENTENTDEIAEKTGNSQNNESLLKPIPLTSCINISTSAGDPMGTLDDDDVKEPAGGEPDGSTGTVSEESEEFSAAERRKAWSLIEEELRKSDQISSEAESNLQMSGKKLDDIEYSKRWNLYRKWVHEYREKLTSSVKQISFSWNSVQQRIRELNKKRHEAILRKSKIIGMTTTGAARYHDVLERIGPEIIFIEEAAEVLEAHVISTLSSKCKHLILIGDHKQLRPSPNVYQLERDFNLDLSLFERLVNNNIPYVTLSEQHRMRPEISQFITNIYPQLKNHQSVYQRPNVNGVAESVFFIDHQHLETHESGSLSKSNQYEAEYIVKLCEYLMKQNYKPEEITILTMYMGQLRAIRQLMPIEKFIGVKLTSVDNFQGEENKIILLSLVRSNYKDNLGFVKIENRICVAMSRAREGLYVIGNMSAMEAGSDLWRTIISQARQLQIVNQSLPIGCVKHNTRKNITNPAEFQSKINPQGGCFRRCDDLLRCGHRCELLCHFIDKDHLRYKCQYCIRIAMYGPRIPRRGRKRQMNRIGNSGAGRQMRSLPPAKVVRYMQK